MIKPATVLLALPSTIIRTDMNPAMGVNNKPGRMGRPRTSCDVCHARKIKCIEIPGSTLCEWCLHQGLTCKFVRNGRRDRSPASRTSRISKRSGVGSQSEKERHAPVQSSQLDVHVGQGSRSLLKYYSIPFFSTTAQEWSRVCGQLSNARDTVLSLGVPWMNNHDKPATAPGQPSLHKPGTISVLPDRFITEACMAMYKCGTTGLLRPVADIDMLASAVETAYSPGRQLPRDIFVSRALVLSFNAYSSTAGHREGMTYPVDGKLCALEADRLLSTLESSPLYLEILQTRLLLALYHCFCGSLWNARRLLEYIARLMQDTTAVNDLLGPRYTPIGSLNMSRVAIFRHFSRTSFLIDEEISLRIGESPLLLADTLCTDSLDFSSQLGSARAQPPSADYASNLCSIVRKVHYELYAPNSSDKSATDTLRTIRTLDDELENWRLSIPRQFRPSIQKTNLPRNSLTDFDALMLNMKFHHCLGYIHQVASRCQDWSAEANTTEALQSSLELSAQASVCSLELLRATQIMFDREKFWVLCFYIPSALLNLFFKLLIDRFVHESSACLKILKDAPLLLNEVDTRHLTSTEKEQLGIMVAFSEKLITVADEATANHGYG